MSFTLLTEEELVEQLEAYCKIVDANLHKVHNFEQDNKKVMSLVSSPLPVERGGWYINCWEIDAGRLYAYVSFYGYEGNPDLLVPVTKDWAEQRITSYRAEYNLKNDARNVELALRKETHRAFEISELKRLREKYKDDVL